MATEADKLLERMKKEERQSCGREERLMAERDLLEEANYLSGCVFAHDVIAGHFAERWPRDHH